MSFLFIYVWCCRNVRPIGDAEDNRRVDIFMHQPKGSRSDEELMQAKKALEAATKKIPAAHAFMSTQNRRVSFVLPYVAPQPGDLDGLETSPVSHDVYRKLSVGDHPHVLDKNCNGGKIKLISLSQSRVG